MSVEDDERDGFLTRWSRRKQAHAAGSTEPAPSDALVEGGAASSSTETPGGEAGRVEDGQSAEVGEESDDAALARLGLPDPETLGPGDDFSRFMGEAVPTRLRNRALRKLWLTNSTLANLDELLDYGEDFTDAATVVENLQTAYQVGRGMLVPDAAPQAEAEAEAGADDETIVEHEELDDAEAETGETQTQIAAVAAPAQIAAVAAPTAEEPSDPGEASATLLSGETQPSSDLDLEQGASPTVLPGRRRGMAFVFDDG